MDKPAVFIGSSTQGLDFARAVRSLLTDDAELTLWNEGFFKVGDTFIETLLNNSKYFDFAILVMTPDDLKLQGSEKTFQPRDNVVFELGLFMGCLGRSKTFVVKQNKVNLPSDLRGVTTASYSWPRKDNNHEAAVGPACDDIRKAIRQSVPSLKTQQQIRAVENEQKVQKTIIDEHQEFFDIVKYSLSAFCYGILWNIQNKPSYMYKHSPGFQRRMHFLADSGYIAPNEESHFWNSIKGTDGSMKFSKEIDGKDLCKITQLTPVGKYLVSLRGKP